MKTAYFIIGPESSGTRMLTQAFCTLGVYGDFRHKQRMDDLDFSKTPSQIIFRRSLPHGDKWPAIADTINLMKQADYGIIIPILILRGKEATIKSQIKRGHAKGSVEAKDNIDFAIDWTYKELSTVNLIPIVICYEPFVKYDNVRKLFFQKLGLAEPQMEFYDGNEKYNEDS